MQHGKNRILVVGAVVMAFVVTLGAGGALADPGVSPDSHTVTLEPGESTTIDKSVETPEIPPRVDVFLLEDESGSFNDDINNLDTLAPQIWDDIDATGTDFTMGVAGFRDFAQSPWGLSNDWVYDRNQDLTTSKTDFVAGVDDLTAGGGGDGEEAQLEALHYIADPSHAAIDSNGDGDTTDPVDTPTGEQPSWRPGATRVVLMATDAPCHTQGDSSGWPGDAGTADPATTASILASQGIVVIGLVPDTTDTSFGSPVPCVEALANGTGGSIHNTTADGSEIGDAILAGLGNLPATVSPTVVSTDPGLSVSFSPTSQTVTSGDTASFTETISVANDPSLAGQTLTAEVSWEINGEPAGDNFTQTITVEVPARQVDIDIKPGSDPNSINCNNDRGVIPVAILSTADFDATTVNHTTVTFEGASETHVDRQSGEPRRHEEDVDGDGDTDLVFHFQLGDTDLDCDSTEGVLIGETMDGGTFQGNDTVRMIDRGGGPP